jgi:DNA repair protein RecO (recombination protein O)
LRIRPLTDTSLIVHWLTRDLGRLATVAKGARRLKSPLAGKLDLFFLVDFSFVRSRRSELHILREAVLQQTYPALRREWRYLQQASYCAALIEHYTETQTPVPGLFDLLYGLLDYLPHQPPQTLTVLAIELKFLADAGLQPDLDRAPLSPGSRQLFNRMISADWPVIGRLRPTALQLNEMANFLEAFLRNQLGGVLRTRPEA